MGNSNRPEPKIVSMDIYAKMQSEQPYKTFKKTIPSIVEVIVFNVFNERPENVLLKGNPSLNEIDSYVPLWSEKEYLFFKRQNRGHIDSGRLIESTYPVEEERTQSPNNFTEEELIVLVNGPFFALKKAVEQMTSEAALYRAVKVGEQQERPEKTMNFLRESLSAMQSGIELESEE